MKLKTKSLVLTCILIACSVVPVAAIQMGAGSIGQARTWCYCALIPGAHETGVARGYGSSGGGVTYGYSWAGPVLPSDYISSVCYVGNNQIRESAYRYAQTLQITSLGNVTVSEGHISE